MSKLGNIYLSYGKEFKISIANTYSNVVLAGSNLPVNSIIISSNVDDNFEDTGSYSLIATDNEGSPVRLSYCFKPGSGLRNSDNNQDVLELKIDNKSIKSNVSGLYIDLSFLNSQNISLRDNRLSVNTDALTTASSVARGILRVDGETIYVDDDTLYINTEKLKYSDNATLTYGIVSYTDNILTIDNGVISLNEGNLPKADSENYGLITSDNNTISIEEGIMSVNTQNLKYASEEGFGIISVDNDKININEGILSVDSDKLNKATYTDIGTISIDGNTVIINEADQISINNYSELMSGLASLDSELSNELNELNEIKNEILSQIK